MTRRANDLLRAKHENSTALVQNFLSDGTVLVADSSNRGKGSPTFIDSARRLGAKELQTIDDFWPRSSRPSMTAGVVIA